MAVASDAMQVPRRTLWNGPVKGGDLFTLHKARGARTHTAICALFSHEFGWELRLGDSRWDAGEGSDGLG